MQVAGNIFLPGGRVVESPGSAGESNGIITKSGRSTSELTGRHFALPGSNFVTGGRIFEITGSVFERQSVNAARFSRASGGVCLFVNHFAGWAAASGNSSMLNIGSA